MPLTRTCFTRGAQVAAAGRAKRGTRRCPEVPALGELLRLWRYGLLAAGRAVRRLESRVRNRPAVEPSPGIEPAWARSPSRLPRRRPRTSRLLRSPHASLISSVTAVAALENACAQK